MRSGQKKAERLLAFGLAGGWFFLGAIFVALDSYPRAKPGSIGGMPLQTVLGLLGNLNVAVF